jgi:NAD(P)-dependent dehydrogenase (short-subunit alcohol dehydrogenase family)
VGVKRRFEQKRCVVAGRGALAAAVAERLNAEGASLCRLEDDPAELATDAGAARAVERARSELGGVDVLVTAFCTREDRPFLEIDDDLWTRSLDENLKCAFLVGRDCARLMVAAGGGVIVNVGSDVGSRPGSGTAAYAAAKAGVHLLTTCMALDLIPDGVRVCAVAACEDGSESPGLTEVGPEDVAAAVAFCASGEASYVLGSTFYLNGPLPVRG